MALHFVKYAAFGALLADAYSCTNVERYYQGTKSLSGQSLSSELQKIVSNHHRSISYVKVWDALKVLDASDEQASQILEIYSLKAASNEVAGKADGWNREHLWPRSYGLEPGSPEFTDLHNLRPADTNVNSSRGNKYFGDCSLKSSQSCLVPANREAAPDTAADRQTWRPPAAVLTFHLCHISYFRILKVRGDIARSLMYMAIRYAPHLKLSDAPTIKKHEMGLLSLLLKWNELDPPSPIEQLRNSRICRLFQHNRNPFVDHPEFANAIWRTD